MWMYYDNSQNNCSYIVLLYCVKLTPMEELLL